jgi:HTH-type transcriptional regulator / antitoxin HipB
MRIQSVKELGEAIRKRRKKLRVTQAELAASAGVGLMFVSMLENGKKTSEVGKVFQVIETLGLDVMIEERP